MDEPYFHDTTCSSISSPMAEQPQDWRDTPSQRAASTRKNLLLGTMTTLVVPASGEACTTKVQFSANYLAGTLLQVRHRNGPCSAIEISMAHRHERTTCQ